VKAVHVRPNRRADSTFPHVRGYGSFFSIIAMAATCRRQAPDFVNHICTQRAARADLGSRRMTNMKLPRRTFLHLAAMSFSWIPFGMPFGAKSPNQEENVSAGSPISAKVGISGNTVERVPLATA
jgi:hypothetical protein